MIAGAREFFRTGKGKNVAVVLAILGVIICVWSAVSNLGSDEATAAARGRVFICSETLKTFDLEIYPGLKIPCESPYSDKATGYPAEMCFWTKDGKIKEEPTAVLINSYVNKPDPTFCPDCGRLVTIRNAQPEPGSRPPPTQAEMKSRNNRN